MNGNQETGPTRDTDYGMAFVSAPLDTAEGIAREIVAQKLAACAQVLPQMTSVYWWKGEMQADPERLIVLKTRRARVPSIEALLRRIHPYEVPELMFMPVTEGGAPYLAWMREILDG